MFDKNNITTMAKREILFRGWNKKNKKWLYGYFCVNRGEHFIAPDEFVNPLASYEDYVVDADTVGQYTGLKDEKGVKIFEGDIVRFSYITDGIERIEIECLAKVVFKDGSFMIKCVKGHIHNSMQRALFAMDYFNIKVEVIGNVTDNPEMVKGGSNEA